MTSQVRLSSTDTRDLYPQPSITASLKQSDTAAESSTVTASTPFPPTTGANAMDTSIDTKYDHLKRKRDSSSSTTSSDPDCASSSSDSGSISVGDRLGQKLRLKPTKSKEKKRPQKKKSKHNDPPSELNSSHQLTPTTMGKYLPHRWSELTIDFIESITAFLPTREISYLHRACHDWLEIADHIGTPHLIFHESTDRGSELIHSVIRRHVKELWTGELRPTESELIAYHLPKLQKLNCWITCTKDSSWMFPSQLKQLRVAFDVKSALSRPVSEMSIDSIAKSVNECLVGVSHLTSLTNLEITMESICVDYMPNQIRVVRSLPINLQSLTKLVDSLTHLALDIQLTTDRVMVLRQLVNLISLNVSCHVSPQQLALLLVEPLPFKLENFETYDSGGYYIWDNDDVPLLKRLIHLTSFMVRNNDRLTDFSFLQHMVQLRDLNILALHPGNLIDSILAHPCQHLVSLTLGDTDEIDDVDLHRIFSPGHMPALKSLDLIDMPNIQSLAFMNQLSATLEKFRLDHCISIEPKELIHLRFLSRLRQLELVRSFPFARQPDSFTRQLIDPASDFFERAWFPALTVFNYTQNLNAEEFGDHLLNEEEFEEDEGDGPFDDDNPGDHE